MISIIIPVFNSAAYLVDCLNSVVSQSYTDYELILVDDGSTDGSGQICYDWGRSNYIMNEVNSDIVILGSSRAIHHYDPVLFADSLGMTCYNSGEDGMGILLMYARYRAIRERKKPKMVIYEVLPDYDLLGKNTEKSNLKYLKFLRPYKKCWIH